MIRKIKKLIMFIKLLSDSRWYINTSMNIDELKKED